MFKPLKISKFVLSYLSILFDIFTNQACKIPTEIRDYEIKFKTTYGNETMTIRPPEGDVVIKHHKRFENYKLNTNDYESLNKMNNDLTIPCVQIKSYESAKIDVGKCKCKIVGLPKYEKVHYTEVHTRKEICEDKIKDVKEDCSYSAAELNDLEDFDIETPYRVEVVLVNKDMYMDCSARCAIIKKYKFNPIWMKKA